MQTLNRSHYAIMKLLCKNPEGLSGYTIKQRFNNMVFCMTACSNSKIYPVLNSLHRKKLVSRTQVKDSSKRKKYLWKMTTKGIEAYSNWLLLPSKHTDDILLKITVGPHQTKEQLCNNIQQYLDKIDETIKDIKGVTKNVAEFYKNKPELFYSNLNIDYSKKTLAAKRKWASEALKKLQAQ
ncbi:MAG: PadR family transcriptional regulator [Gammaproteobacteria bacterium]|nr:PadR family transcriptional regulator [Gammaproteobacteria bacterium]